MTSAWTNDVTAASDLLLLNIVQSMLPGHLGRCEYMTEGDYLQHLS
jgi:hypothetical protein